MELGSISKVNCKAQGSVPPTIHWLKDDETLRELPSHITVNNGTLIFNGVKSSDKGRYTCVAKNAQGSINATISIEVHGELDVFQCIAFWTEKDLHFLYDTHIFLFQSLQSSLCCLRIHQRPLRVIQF